MRTALIILAALAPTPALAQDGAEQAQAKPAKASAEPAVAPAKEFKLENFELFERRNPFSPIPERKPRTPVKKPEKKPDPKPVKQRDTRDEITKNLTLTSVMIPRDGSNRPVAIVEADGAEPKQLKEGDAFLKGTVTAVSLDGITVLIKGTARVLRLGEEFADGTKTHKVYVDTGERVDGKDKAAAKASSGSGGSTTKKKGGISSLISAEERKNLSPKELSELIKKRMRERSKKQRGN
jgi:hypothetical protein